MNKAPNLTPIREVNEKARIAVIVVKRRKDRMVVRRRENEARLNA